MFNNIKKVHKLLDDATCANKTGAKSDLYKKLFLAEGELKRVIRKELPKKPILVFWFQVLKYYSSAAFTFLVIGIVMTLITLNNSKGQVNADIPVVLSGSENLLSSLDKRITLTQQEQFTKPFTENVLPSLTAIKPLDSSIRQRSKKSNNRNSEHPITSKTINSVMPSESQDQPVIRASKPASKSDVLAEMSAPSSGSSRSASSSVENQPRNEKSTKKINSLKLLLEIEENLTSEKK